MQALATGYGLIEGPLWDERRGLIFADVMGGGVWALGGDGTVCGVVPKRRGVGGIAAHVSGGLVLGGRDVIHQPPDGGAATTLVGTDVTDVAIGFNDLTTDADGRVWVGSLAFRVFAGEPMRPGHLHVVDTDGAVHTVADDVTLTNGLGFAPDGRTLYHSDSRRQVVRAYDVEAGIGVSPWRAFARIEDGIPDGLAVAGDGSVWVAVAHGSRVLGFEPDGRLRAAMEMPLPMVTSVCFGGPGLATLYVVTGSSGGPSDRCGSIYAVDAGVTGLALAPARVPV